MFVNVTCNKCGNNGFFDIGDMSKDEAIMVFSLRKEATCLLGGHKESMSPLELFEFHWDNNDNPTIKEDKEEIVNIGNEEDKEEEYVNNMRSMTRKFYTQEELEKLYNIESIAFGGCLCSLKDNEEDMIIFNESISPKGIKYFYT